MTQKTRLRRDDLKALMIETGIELLREDGLGAKTAPIGYADAFRWLEANHSITVSRAQVHRRIWDSLVDYRHDVILNIATYVPSDSYEATISALSSTLPGMPLDNTTVRERTDLLTKMAVTLTEANAQSLQSLRSVAAFDAVFVMYSLGAIDSPEAKAVQQVIVDSNRAIMDRFVHVYEHIADAFGASPGSAWGLDRDRGLEMFSELVNCLNHGASGRSAFEPSLQEIRVGGKVCTIEGLGAAALASLVSMIDRPSIPDLDTGDLETGAAGQTEPSLAPPTTGRIDRELLRKLMIEAGTAVLIEKGFGHGAEQITYSRVFERLSRNHGFSIARAQVHGRIWASQNDFQIELLRLVSLDRMSVAADVIVERAAEEILNTDLSQRDGARLAAARSIRSSAERALEINITSTSWILSQAVIAFHALNTDRNDIVGDVLHSTYESDVATWAQLFKSMAETLNYRPRRWTMLTLDEACVVAARCADVISDGVVARTRMMGETSTYRLAIAGDEPRDWNLLAIGCWCIIDFLACPAGPDDAN